MFRYHKIANCAGSVNCFTSVVSAGRTKTLVEKNSRVNSASIHFRTCGKHPGSATRPGTASENAKFTDGKNCEPQQSTACLDELGKDLCGICGRCVILTF